MTKTIFRCGVAAIALSASAVTAFAQTSASPFTAYQRYDALRRVTGTISADPDGPTSGTQGSLPHRATRNTYDVSGRLVRVESGTLGTWQGEAVAPANWTDFMVHQVLDTRYDALGRKIRDTVSVGPAAGSGQAGTIYRITQYSYDLAGRLECTATRMNPATFPSTPMAATDALPGSACTPATPHADFGSDRITRNLHDEAGQRVQVREGVGTSDEGAEATWAYNGNGQTTTVIDGNGNRAELRYDRHQRQDRWIFPSTTRPPSFNDSTPATALATAGEVREADYEAYGYDANGNRTSRQLRDPDATGGGQTITFAFDAFNRVTFKDLPGSEPDVTYGYDLLGRMTSATQTGHALTFTYDALGRQLTQSGPEGSLSSQFDPAGRRSRLTYPGGFFVTYDYLDTGEMTHIRESGATSGEQVLATFAYDPLGRRTSLTYGNGAITTYGYDAIGQLTGLDHNLQGTSYDQSLTFSYNHAGQITSHLRANNLYSFVQHANGVRTDTHNGLNQIAASGGTTFLHDPRGNLTNDGTRAFNYSSENLLIGEVGAGSALLYDPQMRLVRTAYGIRFAYDGTALVEEYDGSGRRARYVHGPGADEPLVWYDQGGARRFIQADERGSVTAISAASALLYQANEYDEYGRPSSNNLGRFGYTGQAWLPEHGLYYFKARMYDPRGRFMQSDPAGYVDGPNLYVYADGDPINSTDPTGNSSDFLGGCGSRIANVNMCSGFSYWGFESSRSSSSSFERDPQRQRSSVETSTDEEISEPAEAGDDSLVAAERLEFSERRRRGGGRGGRNAGRSGGAEHTRNARPSTEERHQRGQARQNRDRGGEKADGDRRPPRRRPRGHRGPWPQRIFPGPIIPWHLLNPCYSGIAGLFPECSSVIA